MMSRSAWTIACSKSKLLFWTSKNSQGQMMIKLAWSNGQLCATKFSDFILSIPIHRLFFGKKRQRLTALSPADESRHRSSIHEKEDLFSHLHVNVADEGFDLYDGLARYFDDDVELEGQKKRMEVTLVDLPPLLQIQLQVRQSSCPDLCVMVLTIFSAYNSIETRSKRINLKHT